MSDNNKPLISILTFVLNGENFIEQTISSVIAQTYDNIEYIVIDGLSSDNTVNIIKKYNNYISLWISESDKGATDAANKCLKYANGKYVFYLNADDWIEENFIEIAVQTLEKNKNAAFTFGNLRYYSKDGKYMYTIVGDQNYINKIKYTMPHLNFPTLVIKKQCFDQIGLFNLEYKVAPDYEWNLRLYKSGARGIYCNKLYANFRLGGNSDINDTKGFKEVKKASIESGYSKTIANIICNKCILKSKIKKILATLLPNELYLFIRRRYIDLFKQNSL